METNQHQQQHMRAILIDPNQQTVTEIVYSGDYHDIYTICHFDTFDVYALGRGETMFFDDEGLLKPCAAFFAFQEASKGAICSPAFAGCALILGSNSEGESIGTRLPVGLVRAAVRWLSPAQAAGLNNAALIQAQEDAAFVNEVSKESGDGGTVIVHGGFMRVSRDEQGRETAMIE